MRVFRLIEAFRRLVPVRSDALAGQLDLVLVLLDDLAQAEVCDLNLAIVEDDILRLEVVVDNLLLLIVQVLEPREDLRNDQLGLLLIDLLILLQVVVEVRPAAQLQNRAKAVVVDLHRVVMPHHTPVRQLFMDLVLAQRMLDVVVLDLVTPAVIEVVDLAGDLATILQVKRLVHLREATLAEDGQDEVLVVEDGESLAPVDAAVLGLLLVANPLILDQVRALLLFEHLELLLDSSLFIFEQLLLELVDFPLLILINVIELALFKIELTVFVH